MTTSSVPKLLILAESEENANHLMQDLFGQNPPSSYTLEGISFEIQSLSGVINEPERWKQAIEQADIFILGVRFIDVLSIQQTRVIYNMIPKGNKGPVAFFMLREFAEKDFKMSCPFCAQKLWVRDSDVDKKGSCPNCGKAFILPSQSAQLSGLLELPPTISITTILRDNPSIATSALLYLLKRYNEDIQEYEFPYDDQIFNKATVRVQLEDEDDE